MRWIAGIAVALALVQPGCAGDKETGPPPPGPTSTPFDAAGHWEGDCEPLLTESGSTQDVSVTLDLLDTNGLLSGSGVLTQGGGGGGGTTSEKFVIDGSRDGENLAFELLFAGTSSYPASFDGSIAGDTLTITLNIQAATLLTSVCTLTRG